MTLYILTYLYIPKNMSLKYPLQKPISWFGIIVLHLFGILEKLELALLNLEPEKLLMTVNQSSNFEFYGCIFWHLCTEKIESSGGQMTSSSQY